MRVLAGVRRARRRGAYGASGWEVTRHDPCGRARVRSPRHLCGGLGTAWPSLSATGLTGVQLHGPMCPSCNHPSGASACPIAAPEHGGPAPCWTRLQFSWPLTTIGGDSECQGGTKNSVRVDGTPHPRLAESVFRKGEVHSYDRRRQK